MPPQLLTHSLHSAIRVSLYFQTAKWDTGTMGQQGHRIRPFHRRHSITVITEFGLFRCLSGHRCARGPSQKQNPGPWHWLQNYAFFVNNNKKNKYCQTSIQSRGDGGHSAQRFSSRSTSETERVPPTGKLLFFLFLPTARSSDSGFLSLVIMISSVVTEMQSERENAGKRKSIDNNGNVQRRALVSEPMASKFPPNSKT